MNQDYITQSTHDALKEDIGTGDITAQLIPEAQQASARVITRQAAIICGTAWVNEVFKQLDENVRITWHVEDGQYVEDGQLLFTLEGAARSILTGERTALNFLQSLSATATTTHHYYQQVAHTDVRLLDTRKTIPGLRLAQKYAVKCGGGHNHRIGLFDAFLIKENHIIAAGGIEAAVRDARKIHQTALLEVEVESLEEMHQAINAGVTRLLLDNFSLEMMREAVSSKPDDVELEASGNITLETLVPVAETGVDYISIGALTKDLRAIDLSMRFAVATSE